MDYGTARFRRSFVGYDRASVDMEFEKLLSQVGDAMNKNDELRHEIQNLKAERRDLESAKRALEEERSAISRDRASLAESVTSISGKVAELETNLSSAKVANEALQNKIDAAASEKNELQLRLDTVQERNRELTLRERQFDEIEKSVSSIMSVTKRATDRLFQKSVENQENVIRIAGDAAQEAALIRADLTSARDDMNVAFDELQDRIDKIDASLTGAVHKLVAIKHDSGLKPKNADATIEGEVERLLSLRAGEVDYSDGKGYAVPVLGPYSAKFISDAARKVNAGETDGHPASEISAVTGEAPHTSPQTSETNVDKPAVEVKKSYPGVFESSDASIKEANKLLDDADAVAEQKNKPSVRHVPSQVAYASQPASNAAQTAYNPYQNQPYAPQYSPRTRQNPIGFGYRENSDEQEKINPYSGEQFEKVDISTLNNEAPTIDMDSPDLQYIQPQLPNPQNYVFDAPEMDLNMSQQNINESKAAYDYAGVKPTFVPNTPVISTDSVPVQENIQQQDTEETLQEEKSTAKKVTVSKRTGNVPVQNKVKIMVRHGK